ncbi:DgyrCDS1016 [Dimorphilus gyrociliatus]|uniref:DgyrCDS1016 n=1 Tax=Dimorphilus gyrociliatus TaxID=2664684 RepID=A0A7I8V7H4_9ANNE|nr:DgyrCDS1016 [Dimorphilus gyrociliatus]
MGVLSVMNLSYPDVAEQLLKAGANPNVQDRGIGNGRCLLLTPGHDAARVGYVRTLKVLLKYGADTNIRDGHGNTLAHLAAKHGQLSVLKVLARGSDLSIRNLAGQTPLDYLMPEHARSESEVAFLTELKTQPRPLKYLAVTSIRKHLGTERLALLHRLPLPPPLKDNLILK